MSKTTKKSGSNTTIGFIVVAIILALGIAGVLLISTITGQTPKVNIQYSDGAHSATVTLDNGETESIEAPTVESVDVDKSQTTTTEGEHGLGIWADVSSPEAFKNSTIGRCQDSDNYAGSQCWDTSNIFFENYAGRTFSTCGTGAAKGTLNCWEYNAGDEFVMVWDGNQLQPGDIAVFTSGTWGHTGMIMGYPNNGYITLLSQNQGGTPCPGGGSATNIINISLRDFGGAFRPRSFIKPVEPELPIPISNCIQRHVEQGDTMGKIMLECEGTIQYGDAMRAYASTWFSQKLMPGHSVRWGWDNNPSHYGLFVDDDILHDIEGNMHD